MVGLRYFTHGGKNMILAIIALIVLSLGLGAIAQQLLDSWALHRRAVRGWDTRRKNDLRRRLALAVDANRPSKPAPVKRPTKRRPTTDGTHLPVRPEIEKIYFSEVNPELERDPEFQEIRPRIK
jgi:hypothetical protein